jgi:predicted  nucleic acid-binding Zn-ribbon protein
MQPLSPQPNDQNRQPPITPPDPLTVPTNQSIPPQYPVNEVNQPAQAQTLAASTSQPMANFEQAKVFSPSQTNQVSNESTVLQQSQNINPAFVQPAVSPLPIARQENPVVPENKQFFGSTPELTSPAQQFAPTTNTTSAQTNYSHNTAQQSGNRKKIVKLAVGLAAVIVLAGAVFGGLKLLSKPITSDDISKAQTNITDTTTALSDATTAISSATNSSDSSEITNKLTEANTKLSSAKSSYAQLQKSNVLQDKATSRAFEALQKKWEPAIAYYQDTVSDSGKLSTLINDFKKSTGDLTNQGISSIDGASAFLSKFKNIVDSTNQKVSGIQVKIDSNKQHIDAFKAYLTQVSQKLDTAQKHAASKDYNALTSDLDGLSTLDSEFTTKTNSIDDEEYKKSKSIDPYDQFNNLSKAIYDIKPAK